MDDTGVGAAGGGPTGLVGGADMGREVGADNAAVSRALEAPYSASVFLRIIRMREEWYEWLKHTWKTSMLTAFIDTISVINANTIMCFCES